MKAISLISILLFTLSGCSTKHGKISSTAKSPPGVILNVENIKKYTPIGMDRDELINVYQKTKKRKSGSLINGRAIVISTKQRGMFTYVWDDFSNVHAQVVATQECNRKYGECELYSIGNVITYKGPYQAGENQND